MSLRRLISILGVTVVATGSLVVAAPAAKKKPAKPAKPATPVAPAKDPTPAAGSAATGSDASGSAVQPIEDTPPADMNGTSENPDAPHAATIEVAASVAVPTVKKPSGYPIEEVLRPITLPRNTSEISLAPHLQASPFLANDAIHARYGITSRVQVGITYAYFGAYDRSAVNPALSSKVGVHSGKAFGLDVTVLLQDWIAVRVGVPFYVNPTAFGLQLGVPMKFTFGDKFAVGGLDDLLTLRLSKFVPSFYQELYNAQAAHNETTGTQQSNGHLRFSFYGEYQQSTKLALLGRVGIDSDLGAASGGGGAGTNSAAGTATFIRAGLQYSPRHWFDIGGSLGWDSLATLGTFGPQLTLALRI